jgi:hypothetical protein
VTLAVGIVGLGFELELLDARTVDVLWPIALVLLGAFLIARSLRRSSRLPAGAAHPGEGAPPPPRSDR